MYLCLSTSPNVKTLNLVTCLPYGTRCFIFRQQSIFRRRWKKLFLSESSVTVLQVFISGLRYFHLVPLTRWVGKHRTFILKCLEVKCWSDLKCEVFWHSSVRNGNGNRQHACSFGIHRTGITEFSEWTDQHSVYSANKINGMNRTRNEQNMSSHQSCKLTVVVGVGNLWGGPFPVKDVSKTRGVSWF